MKKDFFKDGKMSGKSTVAIICFSLAVIAALGIFSYNRSADELKSELSGIKDNTSETTAAVTESAEQANIPVDDVPVTEANAPAENVEIAHDGLMGGDETAAEPVNAAPQGIDGAVISPVSGAVLSDYSDGELVKSRTLNVWKTHDGIDIAAEQGETVKSAAAGTVTAVSNDAMMGVTVIIDHGSGYEGYYCNLNSDLSVAEGDTVDAGSVIGTVGSSAEAEIAEESHLHFGVKKNGSWTDPADVLSGLGS